MDTSKTKPTKSLKKKLTNQIKTNKKEPEPKKLETWPIPSFLLA